MEIGFIGLGRMGGNMATRLARMGHTVLGADMSADVRQKIGEEGIKTGSGVTEMAALFTQSPRIFWSMVPAGAITDSVLAEIVAVASPGDIVIDGGNSNYKDSQRRYADLEKHGLHFLDCGTSGGVWGLQNGYCLMIGGSDTAFGVVEPIFRDLAPKDGFLHAGPSGAGHFSKMIHNGIEYGMMQAYAEGFEMLNAASEFGYDMEKICHLWNQGSVVRSWLLELSERMFADKEGFAQVDDFVQDSGEGRWTVEESVDRAVPLPVITLSLQMRFRSRQNDSFSARTLAALRNQFGGHAIVTKQKEEGGEMQPSGGHKDL